MLDELLFAPTGWFAIDTANRRVPGVAAGSLTQALALVGRGRVATVVGRLRAEVLGVDVDAAGDRGHLATETLRDWCSHRGLWHMVRASGGGSGRAHLFVVPGVHEDALRACVEAIRAELGLTRTQLDVRAQLRPLSAPHRRGGDARCQPPTDALHGLRAVLEPLSSTITARRQTQPQQRQTPRGGPTHALTPLARARRPLPQAWADYLQRGRAAARTVDQDPRTRSLLELQATTQLVICGYSEDEAWTAITGAHWTAFVKARSNGRRWWWNVWNRAVSDADAWLSSRRSSTAGTAPVQPLAATRAARAALEDAWLSWPARTRHTDYEVYSVILARMDREATTEVAIPQRDLVQDCAVASRTTIRAALARLQTAGLLEYLPTYQAGTTDTAHSLRVPDRLEPSNDRDGAAVSLTGPSRFQPPQPAPPLPLRRALGLATTALLRYLPVTGATAAGLAAAAGFLAPAQSGPTATDRQLRTVRAHLLVLSELGLAAVDDRGVWRASTGDAALGRAAAVGAERHAVIVENVVRERAEFREALDADARKRRWEAQRDAALARGAKAAAARRAAWWLELSPAERDQRQAAGARRFAASDPVAQAQLKDRLARARTRAGGEERARYDAWLSSHSPDELARRSADHAAAFASRPAHERQQLVASWSDHRSRWALPHPLRAVPDAATTSRLPEVPLLERPSPTLDELVLFEISAVAGVRAAAS